MATEDPPYPPPLSTGDSLKNLEDKEFANQCASWHTPTSHRQLCYTQQICTQHFRDRPVTLRFVQNRILSLTKRRREEEAPWIDVVKEWKPSVIVLNRGMHFVALPRFLDELEVTMRGLRAIAPDALVVYRNTPMGEEGIGSRFRNTSNANEKRENGGSLFRRH